MIDSVGTPALYLGFTLLVIVLLAVDFVALRVQGSHKVKSVFWRPQKPEIGRCNFRPCTHNSVSGGYFAI